MEIATLALPEITTAPTAYDRFKAARLAFAKALPNRYKQIVAEVRSGDGVCFVGAAEDFQVN